MTLIAQLRGIGGKKFPRLGRMGIMTESTRSVLYRSMSEFLLELCPVMAVKTEFRRT